MDMEQAFAVMCAVAVVVMIWSTPLFAYAKLLESTQTSMPANPPFFMAAQQVFCLGSYREHSKLI